MKSIFLVFICLLYCHFNIAQHTFSIVAVDAETGEIGSAGATCGDSIIWPGTPGAYLISDIIPGVGAIHTQSYYHVNNQNNAHERMEAGDTPSEIISWLIQNDFQNNSTQRQYGVVDYNNGTPRSSAFTGANCLDYKNHLLGSNYAIQGNILLGEQILDSMEVRFNGTNGCLADKLMAAMQGANVIGADSRCLVEGTSSLSAFIRVAKPTDDEDQLFLDINVAGTDANVEPIDVLQSKFDVWKTNIDECIPSATLEINKKVDYVIYPNPIDNVLFIESTNIPLKSYILYNSVGQIVKSEVVNNSLLIHEVTLENQGSGIHYLVLQSTNDTLTYKKVVVN